MNESTRRFGSGILFLFASAGFIVAGWKPGVDAVSLPWVLAALAFFAAGSIQFVKR